MTELLCHADSYLREFEATVLEVVEGGVVLDRTAFYPGGGGQPCDTGALLAGETHHRVTRVGRAGDRLVHWLEGTPPVPGTRVRGVLDWERRYQLMRTHTALHVLSGIVWRDYGALVTGGNMAPLEARMDFELEHMSADFAREVEEKLRNEVAADREVRVYLLPREEAMRVPDLIRTRINLLPPGIAQVRVVEIVGLDLQADGGTHVARTGEVGRVRVAGHESKGRINKRLRIALEA